MKTIEELEAVMHNADMDGFATPDLPGIKSAGRKIRTKRRMLTGLGGVAAVALLAVPAGLVWSAADGAGGTDGPGEGDETGTNPPVATQPGETGEQQPRKDYRIEGDELILNGDAKKPADCGVFVCLKDAMPAKEPIGAVVDTGMKTKGVSELLFAQWGQAMDQEQNELVRSRLLFSGFRDPETGELMASANMLSPDHPFKEQGELPMYYTCCDERWGLLGYVGRDASSVTVTNTDGKVLDARLSADEVIPGVRVFWLDGVAAGVSDSQFSQYDVRVLAADGSTLTRCTIGRCGGIG